jgi:hypothetical protein
MTTDGSDSEESSSTIQRLLGVLRKDDPAAWEQALEPLVAAALGGAEHDEETSPLTASCLSLIRQRRAVLREDLGGEERAHVESCWQCRKTRATVEEVTWHPRVGELCRRRAGRLAGEERATLDAHLQSEGCRRCARLDASPWLIRLADQLRRGSGTAEALGGPVAVGALRADAVGAELRAVAGFANIGALPLHVRAASPDGQFSATLRESPPGQVVVTVEAVDPSMVGRSVRVEVLGEQPVTPRVAYVTLFPAEKGCMGEEHLGLLEDLAPLLVGGATILASVADQASS